MKDNYDNDNQITLNCKKDANKLIIKPSPNGDIRTKRDYCTRENVYEDILEHIKNVQYCMNILSKKIAQAGMLHDKTKIINQEEYIDLVLSDDGGGEFLKSEWWVNHIHEERHHLNENCPVDVNLIDVMEMLVDKIVADYGRKGYVDTKGFELDSDILVRAYYNTIKLMDDLVVVR